jgi:hypothetical protein
MDILNRKLAVAGLVALMCANPCQADDDRPFVPGGAFDKPHLLRSGSGQTSVGGYAEVHFRYEEEEGVVEERTFVPKRFNLFFHSVVSERLRMAAELEFEEGTEEILLELAILDFEIHTALSFRGGMILTPLGKFNLTHDSPSNKLTERPLVSTQIIPTALSEPGMGIYGAFFPSGNSRLTYEIYGVNGLHDGIVEGSDEGTRIASGRHNIEDNNNSPAFTGRIAYSPLPSAEVGVSWHVGQYNKSRLEDLDVDESRSAKIYALDWEGTQGRFHLVGEYARATVDLPSSLAGSIYADSQDGLYVQASAGFGSGWLTHLPESSFEGVVRYDRVDFDRSIEGDQVRQWGIGLNFKPVSDAAFKLNYFKKWARDRNNVLGRGAGVLFSLATYF